MHVEVITHCYCPPGLEHYAAALRLQYDSLVRYANCGVTFTVWSCKHDQVTQNVLNEFDDTNVQVNSIAVDEPSYLFRRAFGRNISAKKTEADIVWFADCDYMFGPMCLLSLSVVDGLCYPITTWVCNTHAVGDEILQKETQADQAILRGRPWKLKHERKAIGGIQIVPGDVARRLGYCDKTTHVLVDEDAGKFSFRCDVAYRRNFPGGGTPINIPNLHRIRHTLNGYK